MIDRERKVRKKEKSPKGKLCLIQICESQNYWIEGKKEKKTKEREMMIDEKKFNKGALLQVTRANS